MASVLSQLRTFTTVSDTSATIPLAIVPGTIIQSPTLSISFCESWTPATSPRILSLKTSMTTAAKAPSPVKSAKGDLFTRKEIIIIIPKSQTSPFAICGNPFRG